MTDYELQCSNCDKIIGFVVEFDYDNLGWRCQDILDSHIRCPNCEHLRIMEMMKVNDKK